VCARRFENGEDCAEDSKFCRIASRYLRNDTSVAVYYGLCHWFHVCDALNPGSMFLKFYSIQGLFSVWIPRVSGSYLIITFILNFLLLENLPFLSFELVFRGMENTRVPWSWYYTTCTVSVLLFERPTWQVASSFVLRSRRRVDTIINAH
jgi:hypothetical protein